MSKLTLRPWQAEATEKAIKWLVHENHKRFLTNVAPAAGKTIFAAWLAKRLIEMGEIDRVLVIAPTKEVVKKWSEEYLFVTNRHMTKVTSADGDVQSWGSDLCATWAAVEGLLDAFQRVCSSNKTLVICDEHHHAAQAAAWGNGANGAFALAEKVVVLTGTPLRSDGNETVWFAHSDRGQIEHPDDGTYLLTYGQAVDLGYCRPSFFHRHEGKFKVELDDQTAATVSGEGGQNVSNSMKRIRGIDKALEFYTLACKIPYEDDGVTPLKDSYQRSMLDHGVNALECLQDRMPNAGGLVIAPNIDVAEYMAVLLEDITGKKPMLVHSKLPNSENKISAFRNSTTDWIVSVNMINEGVDIQRLRVLVYLPYAQTELAFRQGLGRVVRSIGPDDDTEAYVVMPNHELFDRYAKRVEQEMGPRRRSDHNQNHFKKCPICDKENSLSTKVCECGHEFPERRPSFKTCPNEDCLALNPVHVDECQSCGTSFKNDFTIKLEDALRLGGVARGMDLTEEEVRIGEEIAEQVREGALQQGDEVVLRLIRQFPPESLARIKKLLDVG